MIRNLCGRCVRAATRGARRRVARWGAYASGAALALAATASPLRAQPLDSPFAALPSPYAILQTRQLETPPIDAVPLCEPADAAPELEFALGLARRGETAAAGRALRVEIDRGFAAPRSLVLSLAARNANSRDEKRNIRETLRETLQKTVEPGASRACLLLEAARLDLQLGFYPEAAGSARRALEADGGLAASTRSPDAPSPVDPTGSEQRAESARFYRAEALHLAGWADAAGALYATLALSRRPTLAAAARLRLADLRFDTGARAEVTSQYEALVGRADAFGANQRAWALRAAEAAIAAGLYPLAAQWLDGAVEGENAAAGVDRAAIELRLADVDAMRRRVVESRNRLEQLAASTLEPHIAQLASVRLADLGVDRRRGPARVPGLRAATSSAHRGVARYALGVLAHELRELGELDDALAVLTRLAYEAVPPSLVPEFAADLVWTLSEAGRRVGADGCEQTVLRLGGRYAILSHHADPALLLPLPECYEELQLPALAMRVYRALNRASGGDLANRIALPLARTALENGDLGVVRIAAAGQVRRAGADAPKWLLLLAEAELTDGRRERGVRMLRDLASKQQPQGQRARALADFARGLVALGAADADVDLLTRELASLPADERDRDLVRFGEAALIAGELDRHAGRAKRARASYALALDALGAGAMQTQAAYWLGALGESAGAGLKRWQSAAALEHENPWRSLAALEVKLGGLRASWGSWPPPSPAAAPNAAPAPAGAQEQAR